MTRSISPAKAPRVAQFAVRHLLSGNGRIEHLVDTGFSGRFSTLRDPKPRCERPRNDDYPSASPSDAGPPRHLDIEGQKLLAPFIAGCPVSGGPDEGVAMASSGGIAAALGAPITGYACSGPVLNGSAGRCARSGGDRSLAVDTSVAVDLRDETVVLAAQDVGA